MKIFNTFIILSIGLLAGQCTPPATPAPQQVDPTKRPIASFTVEKNGCTAACEVIFKNTSQRATSYKWTFGDGGTSTEENPRYTYRTSGTYTARLEAKNTEATSETAEIITIEKPISQVVISSIRLMEIPAKKPNGSPWDSGTEPDFIFVITGPLPANTIVHRQESFTMFNNARLPLTYTLPTAWTIKNLSEEYAITVFDNDGTVDETIGTVQFKFSDYGTGAMPYPTTIIKTSNGITIWLAAVWSK